MATVNNQPVGFIKKDFLNVAAAKAAATAGKIVFDSASNVICVDGEVYGGNVQDATFVNNVLTIYKGDGTSIVVDLSDVASATAMMAVFREVADGMGVSATGSDAFTPDYANTNYLSAATNLVDADKALDDAIKDVDGKIGESIEALNGSADIASVTNGIVTIKAGVSETGGIIANSTASDIVLAKVATTGDAEDVSYDHSGSGSVVTANNVQDAIQQIEVALDQVIGGGVTDVKVNGTTVVSNHEADLAVDGTYTPTGTNSNKIATQSTVTNAIDALDVNEYAQAEIDTTASNQTTFKVKGISETNGVIAAGSNTVDLVIDGVYNASTNQIATESTVSTAINALDGSATIASKSGDVVTIKTGITETDGQISNDSGTDIVLEEVAVTGAAADVSITDADQHYTATNVEGALAEIASAVEALQGDFDVIVSTDAASTPAGVKWGDPEITGTLVASADTFHKIYLVPAGGSSPNTYTEYITTRDGSGSSATYAWEQLGSIDVDLTGYVKTITLNGRVYAVDSNSTNISLGNAITAVTGETAISGGESDYVAVTATPTTDSSTGENSVAITSNVKVQDMSTADSSNQGLAEASDVKSYVATQTAVVDGTEIVKVNDSNATTIATVGGQAITTKVTLYWEEWETSGSGN